MGRYYYPNAKDALEAKKQFLREHHYKIKHCYHNTWGAGYVLFDTKEEVNLWYKEHSDTCSNEKGYKPGTSFTEADAIKEIEATYGPLIDNVLHDRVNSYPLLAIGLPSKTSFGNCLFLKFVHSTKEEDITNRFYIHYCPQFIRTEPSVSNSEIRQTLIQILYKYFYDSHLKTRINGSKDYLRLETTTCIFNPIMDNECIDVAALSKERAQKPYHTDQVLNPYSLDPYNALNFFDEISICSSKAVIAKYNGMYYFVNPNNWLIENYVGFTEYRCCYHSSKKNDLIALKIESKWGLYDVVKDQFTLQPICDEIQTLQGDSYIFIIDHKYGVVDDDGKIILECKYDNIWEEFYDDLLRVTLNGRSGKYKNGKLYFNSI